jgi:hypothetical protein
MSDEPTPVKELDWYVDFGPEGTAEVKALLVSTTEVGDLIFVDTHGLPVEMFAAGYWKRVKLKEGS